jgi:hypothetical protein
MDEMAYAVEACWLRKGCSGYAMLSGAYAENISI